MKADVAIVGNGVAGYACAMRLAGHGRRPLLIGPGLPIDRPPLTKNALEKGEPVLLADAERLARRGVDHLDGVVEAADLAARRLTVDGRELEAEAIVLATGLSYDPPPLPGLEVAYVNATPGGMGALAARLDGRVHRVVVVGGGFLGVETAATLAGLGHEVTVLEMLARPLDALHDPLPALALETLTDLGVEFLGGAALTDVQEHDSRLTVSHAEGALDADLVVAATGGRPQTPPGLDASLELPVAVDSGMGVPGYDAVLAVGDLVELPHARYGPIRFPHWDAAIGTGEHAADAIVGGAGRYERLPYWWSDIGPRRLGEVGWAGAAVEWRDEDGLHIGRDAAGVVVCALVVDEPRRLREARGLVLAAA